MDLSHEIKSAIAKHGMWKANLRSAIETGSSEFSYGVVRRDDACNFGKWLHSLGAPVSGSDNYRKCKELHRQFHEVTAEVLRLATTGKKDEAKQAMSATSQFTDVSAKLTTAMMAWANSAH